MRYSALMSGMHMDAAYAFSTAHTPRQRRRGQTWRTCNRQGFIRRPIAKLHLDPSSVCHDSLLLNGMTDIRIHPGERKNRRRQPLVLWAFTRRSSAVDGHEDGIEVIPSAQVRRVRQMAMPCPRCFQCQCRLALATTAEAEEAQIRSCIRTASVPKFLRQHLGPDLVACRAAQHMTSEIRPLLPHSFQRRRGVRHRTLLALVTHMMTHPPRLSERLSRIVYSMNAVRGAEREQQHCHLCYTRHLGSSRCFSV